MSTTYKPFRVDVTAPTVLSFSPVDEAMGVAVDANIVVTFSESITNGTSIIVLKTVGGKTVSTYDTATSPNLTISGSVLTINPTTDLDFDTGYIVEFDAGSVIDTAGNKYAGTNSFNFTTRSDVANQILIGTAVNETFSSGFGNDILDGKGGIDTALYAGKRANFLIAPDISDFTVIDKTGVFGTDTLKNVERIKFSDTGIALDLGLTQAAGQTQLMLGAVLGKSLLENPANQPLVGVVIGLFDQGYTLTQLSGALMRLPIWDVFTGQAKPTNTDIANYLLTRVNGVAPDAISLANAVAALDAQTDYAHGLGDFLGQLALTSANQTQVGLAGLVTTGIAYGW